jgi:phosphotransferase family enzyme
VREFSLPGGAISDVVLIGDTVHRRPGPRAGFVHELLGFFQRAGWPGAPRFLGFDARGREVVSYLDGHVAWRADARARVTDEASLVRVAELVREFHDLTAGSSLAGDQEVVCHNDLAPKNTVYRRPDDGAGLRPVAFIDWDLAAPGRRIHDVAHVCWQYLGLGPGAVARGRCGQGRSGRLGVGGTAPGEAGGALAVAPEEVGQPVSGRVRGSPKRGMTSVLKQVMAVIWSPAVVMTWRP